MKNLSREEVIAKFNEIIEKHANPINEWIFNKEQLFAEIIYNLCEHDNTTILYGNNEFIVTSKKSFIKDYANIYEIIGTVNAKDWFTTEQLNRLSILRRFEK